MNETREQTEKRMIQLAKRARQTKHYAHRINKHAARRDAALAGSGRPLPASRDDRMARYAAALAAKI